MIRLGPGDDGRSVEVAVGDTLELVLDEPVGGGYLWSWELSEGLTQVADHHLPPADAAPGASGRRLLRVQVQRAGRHRLRAGLARPWEKGQPLRRLAVDVVGG